MAPKPPLAPIIDELKEASSETPNIISQVGVPEGGDTFKVSFGVAGSNASNIGSKPPAS